MRLEAKIAVIVSAVQGPGEGSRDSRISSLHSAQIEQPRKRGEVGYCGEAISISPKVWGVEAQSPDS
ncbi:MAG TPA: hypothetical protein VML56_07315, partial [Burkholderiales bacterium]|nr:hypothetical protein [Burkholderiales bacterium]